MRYRSLVRATQPVVEPVSLADAKVHLRIDSDAEDLLIQSMISSARAWAEDYLDRTLILTQWTMRLDSFYGSVGSPMQFGLRADGNNTEGRQGVVPNMDIELPRPPMATVDAYTDVTVVYTPAVSGTTTTLAGTEYRIDRNQTPGAIRPLYGKTWPSHLMDQNSVSVTWWAGYGADGSKVPPPVRSALLMLVAHLWRNREMTAESALSEVPMGTKALLDSVRWGSYR
jgi:hypothetical protein